MHRRRNANGGRKKRRLLRWAVLGAGAAGVAYAVASRQRPGPCVPAGGPDERVIMKDEENLSGLGTIMATLIRQQLEADPMKLGMLDRLNLVLAIEPLEQPETAITMTFSDGYLVLEPGVSPCPDIKIMCGYEALMQMVGIGSGLAALKYLATPEGKELAGKFASGELRIEGLLAHPIGMMRFANFLAPRPGSA